MQPPMFKVIRVNDKQIQVWRSENARIEGIHPDKITYPNLLFELRVDQIQDLASLMMEKAPFLGIHGV